MRRVARFLIRLYPANWRARYGEEFDALLEDSPPGLGSLFDLMKGAIKMQMNVPSFPKLALVLGVAGLLVGLGVSFLVEPRYVSTSVMTFESTPGSTLAVRDQFVACQSEVLSRTSLASMITDPRLDLYQKERQRRPIEDVTEDMKRNIQINAVDVPRGGDGQYMAFEIRFAYSDPNKMRAIVQTLVTKFMEANLFRQRVRANMNQRRSSDQIARLEARIAFLEKRLGIPSAIAMGSPAGATGGIQLSVLDSPSLPQAAIYPNRASFMATGLAGGVGLALVVAVFRRKSPAIPFPAEAA
jgi:hypothetical protein